MDGVYARISDDEQSQYSLIDQIAECKKKAGTNDVMEYIDDGVTGAVLERPALNRLREDVKNGLITRVIIWDPDRFSRDLMIQLLVANELEKRAELTFVNHNYQKTPEGILFFQMRGAFSQFEKAKITERTSRGRKKKAEQRKVVKNSQLFGYSYNQEASCYEVLEDEAKIVRLIFDLFTMPKSFCKGMNGIARYLTQEGIPTKRGAEVWHRQVVRQILLNESYTGNHYDNRYNTEGMQGNKYRPREDRVQVKERPREEWLPTPIPAIITEFQFDLAQRMLVDSKRRYAKESLRKYLLSGIVRCGECNNTMTGLRAKNWGTHHLEYSDIKNYSGAKFKGCGMRIRCDRLDDEVWEQVRTALEAPEEIAAAAVEEVSDNFEKSEMDRALQEIEKIKAKRKNAIKLFTSSETEEEQAAIREEMSELTKREKFLSSKLDSLHKRFNETKNDVNSMRSREMILNHYLSLDQDELTFEDKQWLIRAMVKEVKVFKDRIEVYGI